MEIKHLQLFLLDMDGTIYLDDDVFDGSIDFINELIKNNKQYIFLTNNSSKSQQDYLAKLKRLHIPCTIDNIFTSGMGMGVYLQENYPNKKVYLVGTKTLYAELEHYGIHLVEDNPDIVVVGYDRELTYEKLIKACTFIDDGALFLGTNIDYSCPTINRRFLPDCGSMCQMITNATNKEPLFIGKPNPFMINHLLKKLNINAQDACMIGDRVYTDVAAGFNASTFTICVLTGGSSMQTIHDSEIKPTKIFNSIKDIIPYLK